MKTIQFKCSLLSDVILNQKSATEGPNQTLDFIPGSCFLGISASTLYSNLSPSESHYIFHSGKVRFGDAHPSINNFRSLRVPAAMFVPKLNNNDSRIFIHHLIEDHSLLRDLQLKQCRNGFYDFSNTIAKRVETITNFAIKSAYDREHRRSQDSQMFGYQSLQKGLELFFEVEIDDDNRADLIKQSLCGVRHVGRSKTAQYGLVKIEESNYNEICSNNSQNGLTIVYCDSRIIFLDEFGIPTFKPSAAQLGIDDKSAEIVWEKSQIRTFQYSPWNSKRQSFDTDRCGIEKGSVFVVKTNSDNYLSKYVGSYKNEGFGKVIYNPTFLTGSNNGEAYCTLNQGTINTINNYAPTLSGTDLLNYIAKEKKIINENLKIYKIVNDWKEKNVKYFQQDVFNSQWGNIRNIATQFINYSDIKDSLFGANGYLNHGVAKDKWETNKRLNKFKSFVETDIRELSDQHKRLAIINLASEMSK